MKRIRQLFLFSVLLFSISSLAQDSVQISGRILHSVTDTILVTFNADRIAYYPDDHIGTLNKDGKFSLKFPVPKNIYIQGEIRYGNTASDIIIKAGDSIVMMVDAKHFDSTKQFTGRGGTIQNFIEKHSITKGRINQYSLRIKKCLTKEPEEFVGCIDDEKSSELQFLEENKKGLPAQFIAYWKAYYQYYNYYFIEQYPLAHEILKRRKYTDTIPEKDYVVVKDMPLAFYDSLLQLPPYLLYVTGAIEIKLKAAGFTYYPRDTAAMNKFQDSVTKLTYKLMPDGTAEYYIAQYIYGKARYRQIDITERQFDAFKKKWSHSEYTPTIAKQVEIAERLAPGKPAPDIDIHLVDGNSMKLSDLKGKVVLVNFWGTQSRASFADMVTEEKIHNLMKDKPLEFLHISIEDDTSSINKLLVRYKLCGIFAYLHGGWLAEDAKIYGVQALPSYYLIDEDGNFALQHTPSPAEYTDLILEIEKLFK